MPIIKISDAEKKALRKRHNKNKGWKKFLLSLFFKKKIVKIEEQLPPQKKSLPHITNNDFEKGGVRKSPIMGTPVLK